MAVRFFKSLPQRIFHHCRRLQRDPTGRSSHQRTARVLPPSEKVDKSSPNAHLCPFGCLGSCFLASAFGDWTSSSQRWFLPPSPPRVSCYCQAAVSTVPTLIRTRTRFQSLAERSSLSHPNPVWFCIWNSKGWVVGRLWFWYVKIVEGIALSCVGSMSCIECVSCVEFIRLCPEFVWVLYLFVCCVVDALCEQSSKLQWWMIVKRHDCRESSCWGSW